MAELWGSRSNHIFVPLSIHVVYGLINTTYNGSRSGCGNIYLSGGVVIIIIDGVVPSVHDVCMGMSFNVCWLLLTSSLGVDASALDLCRCNLLSDHCVVVQLVALLLISGGLSDVSLIASYGSCVALKLMLCGYSLWAVW